MSESLPAARRGRATPTVAIVGRPNVGKSTLFNRLMGRRQAIVHDTPGVTRDRIGGLAELEGSCPVQVVDTGGLVPGDDPLGLNRQVLTAVEESDLVLLVVDGKVGLVPADQEVWQVLRRFDKPTLLVVNKGDTSAAQASFQEFYRLGLERQFLISAEHGGGMADLREEMIVRLSDPVAESDEEVPSVPAVAIVGRPNVGKSSLLNRLLGKPRALVSPQAGTTRDPVDTLLPRDEQDLLLIDTAGIRRRSQMSGAPEELAVMMARRQVERCEIAVLVIDATHGVTAGDLAIAGLIWELGRGAVVAVNKWDLLDEENRGQIEETWPRLAEILSSPLRVNLSALTGRGLAKLFPAVDQALGYLHIKLATQELNRILERAVNRVHAPTYRGKPWKLYYATQVGTSPPTFMLFANRTLSRQDTYRRYLQNQLRQELIAPGVPLRLVIRKR